MSDIVDRLRRSLGMSMFANSGSMWAEYEDQRKVAADEIERLRSALAAREADGGARECSCVPGEFCKPAVVAQPVAVQDGFVMVPVEPTGRMVTAGADNVSDYYDDGHDQRHREIARFAYRAMLAAAKEVKP